VRLADLGAPVRAIAQGDQRVGASGAVHGVDVAGGGRADGHVLPDNVVPRVGGPLALPIARSIANQNVDDGVIAWIICAGLAVATEAMCFVMWRRVERWRHRRGATRRALWRTGIVVAIQVGAVASIIGALLAINEYWR